MWWILEILVEQIKVGEEFLRNCHVTLIQKQ